MRHVQHHMAQLNLILRQVIDSAPNWVGRTKLLLIPEGLAEPMATRDFEVRRATHADAAAIHAASWPRSSPTGPVH
jgi:hypothetical protein